MFGDWILSYPGTEYRFGPPGHPVELVEWEQAPDVAHVDDARMSRGDGVRFGTDSIEPGEITISVKIDFTDAPYPVEECVRLALRARAELARVWRADRVRSTPGAVAQLVLGGEVMIEGRTRPLRPIDTHQNVGLVYAELPFVPSHPGAYVLNGGALTWNEVTVGLVPALTGDIVFPIIFPLTTTIESSRAQGFTVDDGTAYPVYTVTGPLEDRASVEVVGQWVAHLNRPLTATDVAVFDTRPGRELMTWNGAPMNLLTDGGALLTEMVMPPGNRQLALRGRSLTGTARVQARWLTRKDTL